MVTGWGIDVTVDDDGRLHLEAAQRFIAMLRAVFDEESSPEEQLEEPRVMLKLVGGPFNGRHALWHKHPFMFVAMFGDEATAYVQAQQIPGLADVSCDVYTFLDARRLLRDEA